MMTKRRRIAVTGGRDFNNINVIYNWFDNYVRDNDIVIHGGCRGVDSLCDKVCRKYGVETEVFLPDWTKGKIAGPLRNKKMLESGIDILFAFDGGKGTKNCVDTAIKLGITVVYVEG